MLWYHCGDTSSDSVVYNDDADETGDCMIVVGDGDWRIGHGCCILNLKTNARVSIMHRN